MNKHKPKLDIVIWVSTANRRHVYRLAPYPFMPDMVPLYISCKRRFAESLDSEVRDFMVCRPYHYEYGRNKGLIGITTEEEEQYLLVVSNMDAADGAKTINFTDYPRLVLLSYPRFIKSIVNYRYVKKFGADHYYKMIFSEYKRPFLFHILKNKSISDMFYLYPTLVYNFRRFLWIVKFMEIVKANGLAFAIGLLSEYLRFIGYKLRGKKITFEYRSLRKAIDKNSNAYTGTKEMLMLRKGR